MKAPQACSGFVLPVTVAILALIAVGIAMMAQRSDELRRLVLAIEADRIATRQVAEASADALFLSGALYRRGDSMGSIKLDGRPYLSSSGAVVRYTDAGALLGLRRAPRQDIYQLLVALGLADHGQIERLTDALLDYTDKDDLERLNGAELPDYLPAKLPPPRNGRVLTPAELQRLVGWRDLPQDFLERFAANVHTGPVRSVNRYTVVGPVLSAMTGLDRTVADELVKARVPGTFLNIDALPTLAETSFLAMGRYITVPSSEVLVTICPLRVDWCQHLSVSSTGESAFTPWHVNYSYRQPRRQPLPDPKQLQALPDQLPDTPPPPLWSPFSNDLSSPPSPP
ncbi:MULTISPECIES: type II secretion system protein GspK [unclassified Roseateles]|uniref:type II secretion system protein GspK n=1 Tax=unclassified Roseateles TaxID=2626991 RepID=UPI0006FA3DFB|nr:MULTISPECIES: type II secretion system protein GspK [unclassified Roseateles]KQW42091.1 hypothetical protein ASC81_22585 [Pelomonas sp. Root405]KRA67694.1 hypothetical protein ASD88_24170 [Pelomonas sp. Root662]